MIDAGATLVVQAGASLGTGPVTLAGDGAELVLQSDLLPSVDVSAGSGLLDVADDLVSGATATLEATTGTTLTVEGNTASIDVGAAAAGLTLAGAGTIAIEQLTLTTTSGFALTIAVDTTAVLNDSEITGEVAVDAGAVAELSSTTITAVSAGYRARRRGRVRHPGRLDGQRSE